MKKFANFKEGATSRGIDPNALPDVSTLPERFRQAVTDYYKLMVMTEAVNEGEEPDWNDGDQEKYFPVFNVDAKEDGVSGFGLSLLVVDFDCTYTFVSSRLTSVSDDAARFLGETLLPLYEGMMLKPKAD